MMHPNLSALKCLYLYFTYPLLHVSYRQPRLLAVNGKRAEHSLRSLMCCAAPESIPFFKQHLDNWSANPVLLRYSTFQLTINRTAKLIFSFIWPPLNPGLFWTIAMITRSAQQFFLTWVAL